MDKTKYKDIVFDDGTEPTVWARSGHRALGTDQQGRYPQAAEPCTDLDELGIRVPDEPDWLERAAALVLGVFVLAVLALLGTALWRLV
jgi:hypothetical protein